MRKTDMYVVWKVNEENVIHLGLELAAERQEVYDDSGSFH